MRSSLLTKESLEIDTQTIVNEIMGQENTENTESTEVVTESTDAASELPIGAVCAGAVVLAAAIAVISFQLGRRWGEKTRKTEEAIQMPEEIKAVENLPKENEVLEQKNPIGKIHNIGRRSGQQDSLGITEFDGGTLAVVADGMGGLADGDKVSQKIVMTMLQDAAQLKTGDTTNRLYEMVAHVNREVNQMLGEENRYKCGSTLIAVLVEKGYFQWISVGDSHIYLYRGGKLLLLNREHVYEVDLLTQAVNGEVSFAEVVHDPKRKGLTSFIGMGELKLVDGSRNRLEIQQGDMLLLMSDGVFNTVSESIIEQTIRETKDAAEAAARLEEKVLARQNTKQDNFTAIIMEIG
jgi:serine/threonine protein phosphatase PrpC